MTEEIVIDGVDVAKCEHYKNNGKCRVPHYQQGIKYVGCNCNEWNCAYKQLKRLEQENKELKNKNMCRETCEYFKRICNENTLLIKYRSALEEINRALLGIRGLSIHCDKQIIKVKAIINEVLNA